jgi:hypothetical protein
MVGLVLPNTQVVLLMKLQRLILIDLMQYLLVLDTN